MPQKERLDRTRRNFNARPDVRPLPEDYRGPTASDSIRQTR